MKIRSGFVSNSSSSSFIIAVDTKQLNECPHCHRHDKNILDLIQERSNVGSDTEMRGRGKDSTIAALKAWSYKEDDEYKLYEKKIMDALKQGMEVAFVDIGYHDDLLKDEFYSQKKSGKVRIILDDN